MINGEQLDLNEAIARGDLTYEQWSSSFEEPLEQSVYKHKNGNKYKVLFLTNLHNRAEYPRTVVYQGENGKIWSRPLHRWNKSMTLIEANNG